MVPGGEVDKYLTQLKSRLSDSCQNSTSKAELALNFSSHRQKQTALVFFHPSPPLFLYLSLSFSLPQFFLLSFSHQVLLLMTQLHITLVLVLPMWRSRLR